MSNDRRYITNNRKTHSDDSSKRHYWRHIPINRMTYSYDKKENF